MIKTILTCYVKLLNEYLKNDFPEPSGVAETGFIGNTPGCIKNKLLISLFGIERETAGGIVSNREIHSSRVSQKAPPVHVNLNIIIAAVYEEKNYAEALSVLSGALFFIQAYPVFTCRGQTYTIEIISPTLQELNNIWSNQGGQYHPSLLCKIRRLTFDSGEIRNTGEIIEEINTITGH